MSVFCRDFREACYETYGRTVFPCITAKNKVHLCLTPVGNFLSSCVCRILFLKILSNCKSNGLINCVMSCCTPCMRSLIITIIVFVTRTIAYAYYMICNRFPVIVNVSLYASCCSMNFIPCNSLCFCYITIVFVFLNWITFLNCCQVEPTCC